MSGSWSRGDKLAVLSLAIGVPLTVLSFFMPEVRRWLGFEAPKAATLAVSSPVTVAQSVTTRDLEPKGAPPVITSSNSVPRQPSPAAPSRATGARHDEITRIGAAKDVPDVVAAAEAVLEALRTETCVVRGYLRAEQSTPDDALAGLITTNLMLDVRLIDADGITKETFTVPSRGGGFSADESAFQARTRLIDELRRRRQKERL